MIYRRFTNFNMSTTIINSTTENNVNISKINTTGLILPIDISSYISNLNSLNQDFYNLLDLLYEHNLNSLSQDFYNLLDLLYEYKQIPVIVIIKVDNVANPNDILSQAIKSLKATGATIVGYIDSLDASKSLTNIEQEINYWKQNYPNIDGIFIDKVNSNQSFLPYYTQVKDMIKSKFSLSIGNPATIVDKSYFDIFDIVNIHEANQLVDIIALRSNYYDTIFKKLSVILKEQTNLDIKYVRKLQDYVGYLYITDKANYTSLSSHLETLFITLETQPELITFTPDGKVGINNTEPKSTLDILGSLGLPLKEVNQDITLTDKDFTILVNTTNTPININLPSPIQNRIYVIKKVSSDTNSISIKDKNIEILKITESNRTILLQSNNNGWKIIFDTLNTNNINTVDNITIGYDNFGRLYVKDNAITVNKLANNVDASNKGFNADKVDGFDVNDNQKIGSLWTGKRITKEAIIKAIIFG